MLLKIKLLFCLILAVILELCCRRFLPWATRWPFLRKPVYFLQSSRSCPSLISKSNSKTEGEILKKQKLEMFYSNYILSSKGAIWVAAYCFKRLKKAQVKETDICSSVGSSSFSFSLSLTSINHHGIWKNWKNTVVDSKNRSF